VNGVAFLYDSRNLLPQQSWRPEVHPICQQGHMSPQGSEEDPPLPLLSF
jgi:hypothetical protein